jgi:hypothetical protein
MIKDGRKKDGRTEGKKEGRMKEGRMKEGRKEGRMKEGRKEGTLDVETAPDLGAGGYVHLRRKEGRKGKGTEGKEGTK